MTPYSMKQDSKLEAEPNSSAVSAASTPSFSPSPPSLQDVLKLLRGKTDTQRLTGLFLVPQLCDKNDNHTILNIYHALDSSFLHRLLLTGLGKWSDAEESDTRDAYLRLSVTVLAALVRVSQIAATAEMLAKIPLILEVMSKESSSSLTEECYEFLFLMSTADENGVITLYESGGISVLASQMRTLPDGSHTMELSMKLVKLILIKLPAKKVLVEHPSEISMMVVAIAKQFSLLHNALKFEALHLLSCILTSNHSESIRAVLQSKLYDDWPTCIRVGIMDILQNRVAPADKLQALVLAESVISIVGEKWLIGHRALPDARTFPPDLCLLLVFESSRVEIAVILNEIAYLKYEASKDYPPNAESFLVKLRNLGITFTLVEGVIKLISGLCENEESNSTSVISESTIMKIIGGLDETIALVLDYLQDAKEHGQNKGDDLLACVRIVGSYLAESHYACKEKVNKLLGYMLSVEGEDEPRPYNAISFLLPMLYQNTMESDGCKIYASTGAFDAVVGYVNSLIDSGILKLEIGSPMFLACNTILNFLSMGEQVHCSLDDQIEIKLLLAMSRWTEGITDPSIILMASSICSLILGSTSEEALLKHQDFSIMNLTGLSQLMRKSLSICWDEVIHVVGPEDDLDRGQMDIVTTGYCNWAERFPHLKELIAR